MDPIFVYYVILLKCSRCRVECTRSVAIVRNAAAASAAFGLRFTILKKNVSCAQVQNRIHCRRCRPIQRPKIHSCGNFAIITAALLPRDMRARACASKVGIFQTHFATVLYRNVYVYVYVLSVCLMPGIDYARRAVARSFVLGERQ